MNLNKKENRELRDALKRQTIELEQKNRELEIESSLEKVRARAMAMQNSDELPEAAILLFNEIQALGIPAFSTGYCIWEEDKTSASCYMGTEGLLQKSFILPTRGDGYNFYDPIQRGETFYISELSGEELVKHYEFMRTLPVFGEIIDGIINSGITLPTFQIFHIVYFSKGYLMFITYKPVPDAHDIFKRFTKVFEQTYTRFLDLQKAEEQAREAQIETALERIRSRSLAMHRSDELSEVAMLLYNELRKLGFPKMFEAGYMQFESDNEFQKGWLSDFDGKIMESFSLPLKGDEILDERFMYWKKQKPLLYQKVGGKKLINHMQFVRPSLGSQEVLDTVNKNFSDPTHFYHSFFKQGALCVITKQPLDSKQESLIVRFTNTFKQTYTRFLDLQKAEAQVKEAQIEAALEKVRSRTMGMQRSDELLDVGAILYQEIIKLGISNLTSGLVLVDEDEKIDWNYLSDPVDGSLLQNPIGIPNQKTEVMRSIANSWKKQDPYLIIQLNEEETIKHQTFIAEKSIDFDITPEKLISISPEKLALQSFNFKQGYLLIVGSKPLPTYHLDMMLRFTAVFGQTYTRFLDLQKAEEQAREAKIEIALERVRSRSMAMHKSEELAETAELLYQQLQDLGFDPWTCGYVFIEEENEKAKVWMTEPNGKFFWGLWTVPLSEDKVLKDRYKSWKRKDEIHISILKGQDNIDHHIYISEHSPTTLDDLLPNLPVDLVATSAHFSHGYLLVITMTPLTTDEETVLIRFAKVFEMTYTRFLDLQKAETQAREAQIEVVLERVRARALAMHSSEELEEVSMVLRSQMAAIGQDQLETVAIHFIPDDTDQFTAWFAFRPPNSEEQEIKNGTVEFSKTDTHYGREFIRLYDADDQDYLIEARGSNLNEWQKMLMEYVPVFKELWVGEIPDHQYWYFSDFSGGNLMLITLEKASEEALVLLRRSAQVFDLAYRRYLDLQKAEEQAKEARIETALERVRSRSMAMHKSDDLLSVIKVVSKQLTELDFRFDNVSFGQNNQEHDYNFWTSINGHPDPIKIHVPYIDTPVIKTLVEAHKNKVSFLMNSFTPEENSVWSVHMAKHVDFSFLSKTERKHIQNNPFTRSSVILPNIQLFVGKYESSPYTDPENKIILRFAQVFEQTYTRFLDLKKAEEQAREAQIEASLERVRSKTMAMHNSKDVEIAVVTLFDEVLRLGLDKSIRCGIGILEGNEGMETWSATSNSRGEVDLRMGMLDMSIHPLLTKLKKTWKKGEAGFTYELIGKDVIKYYQALNDDPGYPFNADLDNLPEKVFHNSFFFSEGILFAFTSNPISEEAVKVLKRFTAVFEQTYTRFLDLQKAEEQTKEAQIEASLERVRAKAMAMHNSEDLVITANQLFKEFQYLDISFIRCGVLKIEESRKAEVYAYSLTKDKKAVAVYGELNLAGHELMDGVFKHWQLQKEYVHKMKGNAVKRYYQLLNKQVDTPKIELGKSHFVYGFYFPEGCLYCFTNEKLTDETLRILRKFNSVMGLTYRRYFELQESEARELAAIKESSLDRVRAEIASMRTADDLNRITPVVWKELTTLGVPFFRCGVFIVDNHLQKVHAYLSSPSGESIAALELEFDSLPLVKGVVSNWKQQKVYVEKWNKAQFIEFTQPLIDQGQIKNSKKYQGGLDAPENLVLQMVPFKQGMLYVGSEDSLGKDHISMVESLANAFSVAYTRYEDFKELEAAKGRAEDTLTELKSTQTQLIQSEKMASLGELTAGIAHEIQNPLNFVNNFSEISEEMLEELAEEIKDNSDEIVEEIMTDLKQNLNKIGLHGKRASNIVNGMLEHSRTSSGKKELTNINVLADEFLRLSYHGLRAKDKTFNAAFKTDFDESLPKVKVIAQDLGRVILNLINNAFYACSERSRSTTNKDYKPTVTVSTTSFKAPSGDLEVEIRVKDNGLGIPDKIKDKIFQPFFTTKPTGSGTGLGLSMSYDIITKGHDGELKVESEEGEYTEFTIVLPNKN